MEKYEAIKVLGEGSFGKVYLMRHKRERKLLCVKVIKIKNIPKKERDATKMEVDLLRRLHHPNIVRYIESFLTRNNDQLCIAMEYCDGGDLAAQVKAARRNLFSESKILHWFVQIALGVQYMHTNNVLHRDLKTQNIFLTGNGRLVLGDLGISKVLSEGDLARTCIGTPYYMSPEIFKNKPYSYKSDVWALGCVLYEMTTLNHAFDAQSINGLAQKIIKGRYPPISSKYSRYLGQLIGEMLMLDPKKRPDMDQILKKPFIKKHIINFFSDIASRPNGSIGEGTMIVRAAAGGGGSNTVDNDANMLALRKQLKGLDLNEDVEAALRPRAAVNPSNPVEVKKVVKEVGAAVKREEDHKKMVEAALERLRSEREARLREKEKMVANARARAAGKGLKKPAVPPQVGRVAREAPVGQKGKDVAAAARARLRDKEAKAEAVIEERQKARREQLEAAERAEEKRRLEARAQVKRQEDARLKEERRREAKEREANAEAERRAEAERKEQRRREQEAAILKEKKERQQQQSLLEREREREQEAAQMKREKERARHKERIEQLKRDKIELDRRMEADERKKQEERKKEHDAMRTPVKSSSSSTPSGGGETPPSVFKLKKDMEALDVNKDVDASVATDEFDDNGSPNPWDKDSDIDSGSEDSVGVDEDIQRREEELEQELKLSTIRCSQLKSTLRETKSLLKLPSAEAQGKKVTSKNSGGCGGATPTSLNGDDDIDVSSSDEEYEEYDGEDLYYESEATAETSMDRESAVSDLESTAPRVQVRTPKAVKQNPFYNNLEDAPSPSGRLADRIERLRQKCIEGLGRGAFEDAYDYLKNQETDERGFYEEDVEKEKERKVRSILGEGKAHFMPLIEQLLFMEDTHC